MKFPSFKKIKLKLFGVRRQSWLEWTDTCHDKNGNNISLGDYAIVYKSDDEVVYGVVYDISKRVFNLLSNRPTHVQIWVKYFKDGESVHTVAVAEECMVERTTEEGIVELKLSGLNFKI